METNKTKEDFQPDVYDRVGFLLFNKSLHYLLKLNEGIVIEINDQKSIVGKWIEDDVEVVGVKLFDDQNEMKDFENGQFVFLDCED